MYLSVHTPTSILIGSQINQPLLAFLIAFVAHLLFDIIPHDPIVTGKWNWGQYQGWQKILKVLFILFFDLAFLCLFLICLYLSKKINFSASIIWAIIGGILPDVVWGLDEVFNGKIKILKIFHQFHSHFIHSLISKSFHIPLKFAILIQSLFFILPLIIYLAII